MAHQSEMILPACESRKGPYCECYLLELVRAAVNTMRAGGHAADAARREILRLIDGFARPGRRTTTLLCQALMAGARETRFLASPSRYGLLFRRSL